MDDKNNIHDIRSMDGTKLEIEYKTKAIDENPEILPLLKGLEKQLTLIRDDFSGYFCQTERHIRRIKNIKARQKDLEDMLKTFEKLNYMATTEKEAEYLKLKITGLVKALIYKDY